MTSSELAKTYPQCPHLVRGHCEWISARLGRPYHVSNIFCQWACREKGPFEGRECPKEDEFLIASWWRQSPLRPEQFALRVINKYRTEVDIVVPEIWPQIFEALTIARSAPGFSRILLTGSTIVGGSKPKDIDIVIVMDNLRSALDLTERGREFPDTIAGIKCDYFIYLLVDGEVPDLYFVCLDPIRNIIYPSRWFELKVNSIPQDMVIQERTNKDFENILKDKLWQEFSRQAFPVETQPDTGKKSA